MFNEFTAGKPKVHGVFGVTKLKNRLKALDPALDLTKLKNVRVNGELMGASGFVTNPANGAIVYVNTDHNHGTSMDNALYRRAQHLRDFTGERNNFASYADLPQEVVDLLNA